MLQSSSTKPHHRRRRPINARARAQRGRRHRSAHPTIGGIIYTHQHGRKAIAQSRTQPRPEAALGPTRRPHRHYRLHRFTGNRGIPRQSWDPTPIVGSHAKSWGPTPIVGSHAKKWGGTVKPAGGGGGSYGRAARATPQPHRCSHTHAADDPRPTRSPDASQVALSARRARAVDYAAPQQNGDRSSTNQTTLGRAGQAPCSLPIVDFTWI